MDRFTTTDDHRAGIDLLRQEFVAAASAMRADPDLTRAQQHSAYNELATEHRTRCAKEWKAISAQLRADRDAGTRRLGAR